MSNATPMLFDMTLLYEDGANLITLFHISYSQILAEKMISAGFTVISRRGPQLAFWAEAPVPVLLGNRRKREIGR